MATAKLFFDKRKSTKDDKYPLVIRVSHKGSRKDIKTKYRLSFNEWNDRKGEIKATYKNSKRANAKLKSKIGVASEVISNYDKNINSLSAIELANLIKDELHTQNEQKSGIKISPLDGKKTYFKTYSKLVIDDTKKISTPKYVASIQEAVNYLLKFHGNDKLLITEIDIPFLKRLEAYYIVNSQKSDSINGLGVYLRNIRKIINIAITDKTTEVTMEHYPFGQHGYAIKKTATKKRAVKLTEIEKLINYKIKKNSRLWHHKNYFLFYFYMRGMNFIDLAHLKMSNIEEDRLLYKRRKTKRGQNSKEFNIKISTETRKILNHYCKGKSDDDFIFPILDLTKGVINPERMLDIYENQRANHNRRLKTLAKMAGIKTNLTTYVARHSFATAGLHSGLTKAEIGDMLGHTNYYTTETYLAGFEQKTLDDAADKIFNSSSQKKKKQSGKLKK